MLPRKKHKIMVVLINLFVIIVAAWIATGVGLYACGTELRLRCYRALEEIYLYDVKQSQWGSAIRVGQRESYAVVNPAKGLVLFKGSENIMILRPIPWYFKLVMPWYDRLRVAIIASAVNKADKQYSISKIKRRYATIQDSRNRR
jgi:hypothetical protein